MVKEVQEVMYGWFGGSKYMVVGPTGAGKTTYVSKFVIPQATEPISQMIGKGNGTLVPKTFVLSEDPEFQDCIRLCAKPNNQPMNRKDYDEVIVNAFGSLAKQAAKENVKHMETAEQLLRIGFIEGDNYVSFLGLLEDEAADWIAVTSEIMEKVSREDLRNLYDIARARIDDPEAAKAKAKSSDSMDAKLSEVFRDYLEGSIPNLSGKDIGRLLTDQYIDINERFQELAKRFFNEEKTADGYLTISFPLTETLGNELQEKKNAFFSNNSNSEKISMEVLYEDIVIYVGINSRIVKQLGTDGEKFRNRNGYMEFGLIDTMGAFHRFGDKSEVQDYLLDLFKKHEYDGVILLVPLTMEANEKKFVKLSREFFRQFSYNLDMVIISNKVDRFIDQFEKEWKSKNVFQDPFADDEMDLQEKEMDGNSLKEHLLDSMSLIEQEITETVQEQGSGRVDILAHYTTSFVQKKFDTMGLDQLKLLPETIIGMLRSFAESKKSVDKIDVEFDDSYGSDIGLDIETVSLQKGITQILQPAMFTNVSQNCRDNLGKIPHGQSFNALPSRLRSARGYNVDLDERFKRVHSFKITFPGTISNSLKSLENDIHMVLQDCISFKGVRNLKTEVKAALLARLSSRLSVSNITSSLVYTETFLPVMNGPYYSFGAKFQAYIGNVKGKLTNATQCEAYAKAVEKEVLRSFKSILDSDVVYRR